MSVCFCKRKCNLQWISLRSEDIGCVFKVALSSDWRNEWFAVMGTRGLKSAQTPLRLHSLINPSHLLLISYICPSQFWPWNLVGSFGLVLEILTYAFWMRFSIITSDATVRGSIATESSFAQMAKWQILKALSSRRRHDIWGFEICLVHAAVHSTATSIPPRSYSQWYLYIIRRNHNIVAESHLTHWSF